MHFVLRARFLLYFGPGKKQNLVFYDKWNIQYFFLGNVAFFSQPPKIVNLRVAKINVDHKEHIRRKIVKIRLMIKMIC